jgi:predicted RecB family nuclease
MSTFLSKSKFISGSQCHLKLWFDVNKRGLAEAPDAATQAIFNTGHEVGELAQQRWPGGVLVDGNYWEVDKAIEDTKPLLADKSVKAIYEAAIEHQDSLTRVDILARAPNGMWDLIEVKSSTRVKAPFDTDVAMQYWVLKGAGIKVRKAGVLVLNRGYVYEGGVLDLNKLFKFEDLTGQCEARLAEIEKTAKKLKTVMRAKKPPSVEVGDHCDSPYECPYWATCTKGMVFPERPLTILPNFSGTKRAALMELGIESIDDLPADFPLSAAQSIVRDCALSGENWTSDGLAGELAKLTWPASYLDFEAAGIAIPKYKNTSPYDQIPFQFSCHVQKRRKGKLNHQEFLATDSEDPREMLALALIDAVGEKGSIVVYSGYEARTIRALAKWLPELSPKLLPLLDRLYDLLVVVRNHYCSPDFGGSYSIKSVLPAMVKDMSYDGMDVSDGMAASAAWQQMTKCQDTTEKDQIAKALLEYCGQDSLAMVKLREALEKATKALPSNQSA